MESPEQPESKLDEAGDKRASERVCARNTLPSGRTTPGAMRQRSLRRMATREMAHSQARGRTCGCGPQKTLASRCLLYGMVEMFAGVAFRAASASLQMGNTLVR